MYIYKITNNINGKIYIGQTVTSVESRFKSHSYKRKSIKSGIDKAIQKYGIDNFSVETLCEAHSLDELNRLECYYIKLLDAMNPDIGYNQCEGGGNTRGYRHKEESKIKMSKSRMGIFAKEKNPFYGKHHSKEQIEKWKKERKGRKLTESWKQHLSDTSPRKRPVYCVTTGEHFNSIVEASNKFGIEATHISRVCKGKQKTCKGYQFIYDNTVPSLI